MMRAAGGSQSAHHPNSRGPVSIGAFLPKIPLSLTESGGNISDLWDIIPHCELHEIHEIQEVGR
jgi:hypothetical protein